MVDRSFPEYFPFDASRPVPAWYLCLVRAGSALKMDPWEIQEIAEAGVRSSLGGEEGMAGVERLVDALRRMGRGKLAARVLACSGRGCEDVLEAGADACVESCLRIDLGGWTAFWHGDSLDLFGLRQLGEMVKGAFRRYTLYLHLVGAHPRQCAAPWALLTHPGARVPVPVLGFDAGLVRGRVPRGRKRQAVWREDVEREVTGWLCLMVRRSAGEFLGEEFEDLFVPSLEASQGATLVASSEVVGV